VILVRYELNLACIVYCVVETLRDPCEVRTESRLHCVLCSGDVT
jgi:hypothetical protein